MNANYVKGRHHTELDKQALRYIIDIARPSRNIESILEEMNKDYTIREGKTGENYRQLDKSFSFEKEGYMFFKI